MDSNNNRLISIVMPVRNVAGFIDQCIQSILDQTIQDWELIITDDASTDDTYSLIKDYCLKDSRIRLVRNNGKGIIEALRLAYSLSEGNYITRMDGDDIMANNKLETLRSGLEQYGEGSIATGQVKYFSDAVLGEGYQKYQLWLNELISTGNIWKDIYKECVVPSPCWMVHRSDFEKAGAMSSGQYPEDYDLAFRFYKLGLKPIPCQKTIHFWRDYDNRTSRTDPNYQDNTFLALKCKYFLEIDHDNYKKLSLLGAGKKGKRIARYLIDRNIHFDWISNNMKKVGHDIFGKIILDQRHYIFTPDTQYIIAIANPEEQNLIKSKLNHISNGNNEHHYFFC